MIPKTCFGTKQGRLLALLAGFALLAAACSTELQQLSAEEAQDELDEIVNDIDFEEGIVTDKATLELGAEVDLIDTLPPIDEYPIVVDGRGQVELEIFASTEKSGDDTDGWLNEIAEEFNNSNPTLANGSSVSVDVRKIASGTGYQYIAAGRDLPDAFSPSNHLWIQMAAEKTEMTPISEQLVPNVAGIVMKTETADRLGGADSLTPSDVIDAVVDDQIVMGYTDPFASSTGLNFLLTVLDDFAEGDEARITAPDVASVFEQFQRRLPFVALTTLQIRESVENDNGTLDAFVMEWQTFVNTDSLESGFEFIPFGIRHDNPLYAVGNVGADKIEGLELFADFATSSSNSSKAQDFGFEPPSYDSSVNIPSGSTLVQAQQVWKEKKDGGRPVAAVFVVDTSGSMAGSRIQALHRAMLSATDFVTPGNSVGVVEFNDRAVKRLEIEPFNINHQGKFVALANDLVPGGGTAMYDGVVLGLKMLTDEVKSSPDTRPLLIVLTDGEVTAGKSLGDVDDAIAGLRIPVHTVGFEADLDELGQLSALVEAASINASEANVEFKMAALFNAGL